MSAMQAPAAPPGQEPATQQPRAPSHVTRRRAWLRPGRLVALALVIALIAIGLPAALSWIDFRRTHSITDDAFVEAHIVNVAPQIVSGRLIQFWPMRTIRSDRDKSWRKSTRHRTGIRSISPGLSSNRRRPNSPASAPTWTASAKKCRSRSRSPDGTAAAAVADRAKAEESLKLTSDEVEKGIDEARAGVKAAQASLTLAELEYTRFTRLEQQGASPRRQQQQVTQSRDSALAQVDLPSRLAKALASRTQIDVARRTLEAAEKSEQKAAKGIDLAEIGNDQIREIELLVKVKEQSVEQARRVLEAAESDLAYTRVRAPVSRNRGQTLPAPGRLLTGGLAYTEHVQSGSPLHGGQPGGGSLAGRRAWQSGSHQARRLPGAVSRAGRLGEQIDRRTVRAHAEECGLRRVYARRSTRARPHPDRTRRPLAATPRRAIRDRGNRSWTWRRRLGGGCVPGNEGTRDAIQRHGEA